MTGHETGEQPHHRVNARYSRNGAGQCGNDKRQ